MRESFKVDDDSVGYLEATLGQLSGTAGYRVSLDELIERWKRFVHQVEQGYDDSIYEYANDLAVRHVLKRIEINAPASLRQSLSAHLMPVDQRFFQATRAAEKSIPALSQEPDTVWLARIPEKPVGGLLEDLRSYGLVS